MVVEDSEEDFFILQRAFEKNGVRERLLRFDDGQAATQYLSSIEDKAAELYPVLILLDLNLPFMDGLTFLSWIKNRPVLKKIPVLVLTTSCNRQDIDESYLRGANSYLCKPQQFDEFVNVVLQIKKYWLEVAVMPFKVEPIA